MIALLVFAFVGQVHFDESPGATVPSWDCGAKALYTLLRLENVSTDALEKNLRLLASEPEGFSMAELRTLAGGAGLKLSGVLLKRKNPSIDRPMIVFVKRGSHGHYLVIRPVGHTGKLVQILDGAKSPDVLDTDQLQADVGWTGLALVPTKSNSLHRTLPAGLGVLFGLLSLLMLARRRTALMAASVCSPDVTAAAKT